MLNAFRCFAVLISLLLLGCKSSSHMHLDRFTAEPIGIYQTIGGKETQWCKVKTEAGRSTVDFNGKIVVFDGVKGVKGFFSFSLVDLRFENASTSGGNARIKMISDGEKVTIETIQTAEGIKAEVTKD